MNDLTSKQLDDVYDIFDNGFKQGNFEGIDLVLNHLNVENASIDFILGVLTSFLRGLDTSKERSRS